MIILMRKIFDTLMLFFLILFAILICTMLMLESIQNVAKLPDAWIGMTEAKKEIIRQEVERNFYKLNAVFEKEKYYGNPVYFISNDSNLIVSFDAKIKFGRGRYVDNTLFFIMPDSVNLIPKKQNPKRPKVVETECLVKSSLLSQDKWADSIKADSIKLDKLFFDRYKELPDDKQAIIVSKKIYYLNLIEEEIKYEVKQRLGSDFWFFETCDYEVLSTNKTIVIGDMDYYSLVAKVVLCKKQNPKRPKWWRP